MAQYGVIYIAHNERDGSDMFKVGMTTRTVDQRMAELTADTSNIGSYSAKATFVVFDVDAAEAACHSRLRQYRVQQNREFFELEFERLVRMLKEEIEPFSATNSVPDLPEAHSTTQTQKPNLLDRIHAEKQGAENTKIEFEQRCAAAKQKYAAGVLLMLQATHEMKNTLGHIKELTWKTGDIEVTDGNNQRHQNICSVVFHSSYAGDVPTLSFTGIRGGIYGTLDLSRAIENPKVDPPFQLGDEEHDHELVAWREKDDGRYGEVQIGGNFFSQYDSTEYNDIRTQYTLRYGPISYDDYRSGWSTSNEQEAFNDPQEALDHFEAVIVKNIARIPNEPVRSDAGEGRRKGECYTKISDKYGLFIDPFKSDE